MDKAITDLPAGKLADNLFHVGVKSGPSYLLVYDGGLALIDTAFPGCEKIIVDKIRALGYDPKSIRHIIHTHGHIDHIGSTAALVRYCGARTYLGRGDEDAAAGRNDLTYAGEYHIDFRGTFEPDVLPGDGDILDLAGTRIRFKATPGHTAGTVSLFFPAFCGGREYKAGMFGGAGLNTLTLQYLNAHRLPLSLRPDYLHSLDLLEKEDVNFHVGNHLGDNDYENKIHRTGGENPFAADNTYYRFLARKRREAEELFAKDI